MPYLIFSKQNLDRQNIENLKLVMDRGNKQRFSNIELKTPEQDIDIIKKILKDANENWV